MERGVLIPYLAKHPTDWAGHFLAASFSARRVSRKPSVMEAKRGLRALAKAHALGAKPWPPLVASFSVLLKAKLLLFASKPKAQVFAEEVLKRKAFPEAWKLHKQLCLGPGASSKTPRVRLARAQAYLAAVLKRIRESEEGKVPVGGRPIKRPDDALEQPLALMIQSLLQLSRSREAEAVLAEARRQNMPIPFVLLQESWIRFAQGKRDEAIRLVRGALKHEPDSKAASLALIRYQRGAPFRPAKHD